MHVPIIQPELIHDQNNGQNYPNSLKSVICSHFSIWHTKVLLVVIVLKMHLLCDCLQRKVITWRCVKVMPKIWVSDKEMQANPYPVCDFINRTLTNQREETKLNFLFTHYRSLW